MTQLYDVAVVGGGPAGLSAALLLGRCRRRVVVVDHRKPRNYAARAVHGYLGLDGVEPRELRRRGIADCRSYGVTFIEGEVVRGSCQGGDDRSSFWLELENGISLQARKLLLATGVVDDLPAIPGFERFYGVTAHHCPYCDGWEHREQRLVAYGKSKAAAKLSISLLAWSKQVTCCTDGVALPSVQIQRLRNHGIHYRPERIERLHGSEAILKEIEFAEGDPLPADAFFFSAGQGQRSRLAEAFGCECDARGLLVTGGKQGSGLRGLFLAGDAVGDVQFAIVAAAEGAIAATAINAELTQEDYP